MGTIPVFWGESAAIEEALSLDASVHWAREVLEVSFDLIPLDTLNDADLAGLRFLMLAQPRALSPMENVALDRWVRNGGHVLLFADPMMTGDSRFPIGDRRRPQDVALLSPILARWGLEMQFDVERDDGPVLLQPSGVPIPVNRPGAFVTMGGGGGICVLSAEGVLAECDVGKGRVVVVADAALLDFYDSGPEAVEALHWLTKSAFRERGK